MKMTTEQMRELQDTWVKVADEAAHSNDIDRTAAVTTAAVWQAAAEICERLELQTAQLKDLIALLGRTKQGVRDSS